MSQWTTHSGSDEVANDTPLMDTGLDRAASFLETFDMLSGMGNPLTKII